MEQDPSMHARPRRSSIFSVEHRPQDVGQSVISCQLDPRSSFIPPKLQREIYENTYKMEPDVRFDVKTAKALVDEILAKHFTNVSYDPLHTGALCKKVSHLIKEEMKNMETPRFKYVCNVSVGQNGNQGVKIASRYLWDARRDTWFQSELMNQTLFVVATVFALYYE